LAVNMAASLTRELYGGEQVCVVDGDPLARDVTTRLAAHGITLEDFASSTIPDPDTIGRFDASDYHFRVLGNRGEGLGRIRLAAERARALLETSFDVVIWDLVGGPNGPGRVVGERLDALDWLLLAVTPEPGAIAASKNFLEHFETARQRNVIDPALRLGIVCTGDEGSNTLSAADIEAALDRPVMGEVPQLWGRAEPNLGFGAALAIPELDDAVVDLFSTLWVSSAD
jgi:cellulose biosynthesis protein BcsQ